ncbi:MAG: hypothetical protein WC461_00850 [Candidatus Paceibacterota bacterium]
MSRKFTGKGVVTAKDVVEMTKMLEALAVVNKSNAKILRAAKNLAPEVIGEDIEYLREINNAQADELGVLAEIIMSFKNTLKGDATIHRAKGVIICKPPERYQ